MYRVLHIDESALMRRMLSNLSQINNVEYIGVSSHQEGLEALHRNKTDLIITNLGYDDQECIDFIKYLNNTDFKNIPVIVLTSNESLEMRYQLFSLGVVDFILKDTSPERIIKYIENFRKEDKVKHKLKSLRIAVCDDSKIELKIISNIFELYGIKNVDYFSSGEDLLASNKVYDIYVIDLVLPVISGEQVIFTLRNKYEDCVIIAISAIDNVKSITGVLLSGADDFITKPFNVGIFMARLKASARLYIMLRELVENTQLLEDVSKLDSLTGFYTCKYANEILIKEISKASRYKRELSILLIDIDDLGKINDKFGDYIGDTVLMNVSNLLKSTLRLSDIVSRYGDDEFLILLPETSKEKAYFAAERVQAGLKTLSVEGLKITCSIAIGAINETANIDEMIKILNNKLLRAKSNGKNKIEP